MTIKNVFRRIRSKIAHSQGIKKVRTLKSIFINLFWRPIVVGRYVWPYMNLFIVVEVRKMYVLLELEKVKKNSYEEYFW